MRLTELSRRSQVTVASIKYYLREGLLPAGRPVSSTASRYGVEHLHRLRLIRVLREVGGLTIADLRGVLAAVDNSDLPLHEVLGSAHRLLGPRPKGHESAELRSLTDEVGDFIELRGWRVGRDAPARHSLAQAVMALRKLGWDVKVEDLARYASAVDSLAADDVSAAPAGGTREEIVEFMVVGTVVFDAVLVALRHLAQEHHSARRFG